MSFQSKPFTTFPDYGTNATLTTTLNQGSVLGSTITEITLTNASNFPTLGKIKIDNETIYYNSKSGNTLTGCARGSNSSTATTHVDGSTVTLLARSSQSSRGVSGDISSTGWYRDRAVSNRALRVGFTNIMMPGTIRYNSASTSGYFQGFNGTEWITFNALQGDQGEPGQDAIDVIEFENLGSSTSGQIYASKADNTVQLRSLKSGTFELNAAHTTENTITIVKTDDYLTLYPAPRPYVWDFTSNNDLSTLKSSTGDSKFVASGMVMKFNVKTGSSVSKGTCVRLTISDSGSGYSDASTYLVIETYTYSSLVQETMQGSAFLGIALESKGSGEACEVCVRGVTSVIIGEGGGAGGQTSTILNGPGAYGFVGFDGKVYNESISTGISINTPVAGYWLERGGFTVGDPILFFVQGTFSFT